MTIPAYFAHILRQFAAHPALVGDSAQLTYAELDAVSNQLAHLLLAQRGVPGDRVALLLNHDVPLLAAILAVIKAGRIVVVLNASEPPARLQQVLADAEPAILITDAAHRTLAASLTGPSCRLLCIDDPLTTPYCKPEVALAPGDIAFLVYTSGTTGRPKGVMQTHRNILHNMLRNSRGLRVRPDDRIALLASPSGGQGVGTMWCALLCGAALHPFPTMERGVTGLADWMIERRITLYVSAASLFRHWVQTFDPARRFPCVRTVRLASEPATSDDFSVFCRHFPDECILLHTYSSSEAGNITQCPLTARMPVAAGRLAVGEPVTDMELLLLDDAGGAVAPGEVGEIVIRSRYLSPGYWRDPALTAARFSGDDGPNGPRMFRTGDRGQRAPDGTLRHVGRGDTQVKIHGFRVELSEIERVLIELPTVQAAAVSVRHQPDKTAQLVAFIVPRPDRKCDAAELRKELERVLPRHMIPAFFIPLDQLPLTAHGKIDHEMLRRMPLPPTAAPTDDPAADQIPATAAERVLLGLWRQVFPHVVIARSTRFFDLGGDSLSAAVIAARLHAALQVEVELRAFSDHPTFGDLARFVDELCARRNAAVSELPPIAPGPHDAPAPLSFAQEGFWKYAHKRKAATEHTMATSIRIHGNLDVRALREAMSYIVRRHEMLRTTFKSAGGTAIQIVHPPEPVQLPFFDFSADADPETKATRLLRHEARQPIRLDALPLLRFMLVRIAPHEHLLLRVSHHILLDTWSWTVYFRELGQLYEAALGSDPPPLPDSNPLQYRDYAAWQRHAIGPGTSDLSREVDWWGKRLAGLPQPAELPFVRRWRNPLARPADGFIWWGVDRAVSQRLGQLAGAEGATGYMVRLAAFAALLGAECGQPQVIIGTHLTNRNRVETLDMLGLFTNFATLPLKPEPSQSFSAFLAAVRNDVGDMQAHSQIPHAMLCDELRTRGIAPPEIRAAFRISDHTATLHFGGLELAWADRRIETMPWRFTLAFDQFHEESRCHAAFDVRRYHPRTVRAFLRRFNRFLDAVSRAPECKLADLLARCRDA